MSKYINSLKAVVHQFMGVDSYEGEAAMDDGTFVYVSYANAAWAYCVSGTSVMGLGDDETPRFDEEYTIWDDDELNNDEDREWVNSEYAETFRKLRKVIELIMP